MTNKVTIVIPSFNRNNLLDSILYSYLNQDGVAEIIIVDDGSDIPVSESLNNEFRTNEKIRIVRHNRSLGLCAARNTGIMEAKTEFVFFGEDDLILSENHIANLLIAKEKLNADLICGNLIQQIDDESLEEVIKINESNKGKNKEVFNNRLILINQNSITEPVELPFAYAIFLAPTELLKKFLFSTRIGGPSFNREDQELQLCLRKNGYRLFAVPDAIAFHLSKKKGQGSGTRSAQPFFVHFLSCAINNWQVIESYYDLIAPFFNMTPKKTMLRKILFWTFIIELKRRLQIQYKIVNKCIILFNKYKLLFKL